MTPRCPKCQAEGPALYLSNAVLESGERLEEVLCRLCGKIVASRILGLVDLPVPQPVAGRQARIPCAVEGCTRKHSGRGKLPLCRQHRGQIWHWKSRNDPDAPPPVQLVNGRWIEEAAAIAGVKINYPSPNQPQ